MDSVDMLIYHPEDYESTKGHSVLRNRWGYGGRAMSPVDDLYLSDIYRPRYSTYYDTTGTENEIRRNVNRELLFSTHAADDAFDMAAKSKNRDQEILREAYNAIVNTETHASPKAAVASRRARSHSHFTYHHPTAAPKSYLPPPPKTMSTPSQSYVRRPRKEVVVVSSFSRPRPASATDSNYRVYTKKAAMADWYPGRFSSIPHYSPWWPFYTSAWQQYHSYYPLRSPRVIETVFGPKVSSPTEWYSNYFSVYPSRSVYPARYRLYDYDYPTFNRRTARFLAIPLVYKRKYAGKAALVGSKVDVVTPKSRRPKSDYAAKVIRRIKKEEREQTAPEDVTCSSMSASKPVSTTFSTRGGKAIRDVDGFTQPKNVLSWQYRIESRVDPEDIIEMPKTYAAVKEQMKQVQCKMDKHRQLMDRYLEPDLKPESEDVKSKIMNLYVDMEQRNPSATGEGVTSSSTEYSEKITPSD